MKIHRIIFSVSGYLSNEEKSFFKTNPLRSSCSHKLQNVKQLEDLINQLKILHQIKLLIFVDQEGG